MFSTQGSWGKGSEAVEFKPIKGNLTGPTSNGAKAALKVTKKKRKSRPKKPKTTGKVKKAAKDDAPKAPTTPKVKSGRIEKTKTKKQQKQQKLQMTAALAKGASEGVAQKTLQGRLQEELMGGRFRYINEQLYTMDSKEAEELFRQDEGAFGAYHAGYRHQVDKWPMNPLNRIVKMLRRLPKTLEVGDFGCGEGKLAEMVPNKVYSMDLVSCREDIIACDIAQTPLQPQSLDVAVFCLSLMGTNLNDFLLEANRVLKMDGLLYIAEIQSRFEDVRQFVRCLDTCGFELIKKDTDSKVFYFFQFKKVRNVGKVAILQPFSLKPCLYRKR